MWMMHVFCARCRSYITTEIDSEINARAVVVAGSHNAAQRRITVDGQTRTLKEWAARLGIPLPSLHARLSKGWSERGAVTTPFGGAKN
jgi:hypothetical protein